MIRTNKAVGTKESTVTLGKTESNLDTRALGRSRAEFSAFKGKSENQLRTTTNQFKYDNLRISQELDKAITKLKVKNEIFMTVDGGTVKDMDIDLARVKRTIKEQIEKEKKENLDNSAVVGVDENEANKIKPEVHHIANLINQRPIANNSKVTPQQENVFYRALTKKKQEQGGDQMDGPEMIVKSAWVRQSGG